MDFDAIFRKIVPIDKKKFLHITCNIIILVFSKKLRPTTYC